MIVAERGSRGDCRACAQAGDGLSRASASPLDVAAQARNNGVMPRKVDPKRTRKALRIVRKLAARGAAREDVDPETGEVKKAQAGVDYSTWENAFLGEVGQRLEKYGSAFRNLSKGRAEDALSLLQTQKLKEIAAKAKGKPRKPLRAKKPMRAKRKD